MHWYALSGSAPFVICYDIIKASWETKKERLRCRKKYIEEFIRVITFLIARPPFNVVFGCFLCLLPPYSQVSYLLIGPYKDTWYCYWWYSVWWYYEWTVENMKISCNLILAGWHLQKCDFTLDFVSASVVLVMTSH